MSITDTLEVLKGTLAKAEADEANTNDRAVIDPFTRGLDAGVVIGLRLAIEAMDKAVQE